MLPLPESTSLRRTPLYDLHIGLKARMVSFAGYEMPVQYEGILAEHLHTRASAGLFDVSHMGQAWVIGAGAGAALERLTPSALTDLAPGQMRYTVLLNDRGGIVDDLMVTKFSDDCFFIVVNAACKENDFRYIQSALGAGQKLDVLEDRALIALQGPTAVAAFPDGGDLKFMTARQSGEKIISRSGYTGEDGFEISLPAAQAGAFVQELLKNPAVKPVGLGARDSLRLEAGLCLYGHDIDENTTPVEAGLNWIIQKRRRETADFPGAARILDQITNGPERKRVGLKPEGRQPVREGAVLQDTSGKTIGNVTSGGFGPSVDAPVAMGYVQKEYATEGTRIQADVRGKALPCMVVRLPFVAREKK